MKPTWSFGCPDHPCMEFESMPFVCEGSQGLPGFPRSPASPQLAEPSNSQPFRARAEQSHGWEVNATSLGKGPWTVLVGPFKLTKCLAEPMSLTHHWGWKPLKLHLPSAPRGRGDILAPAGRGAEGAAASSRDEADQRNLDVHLCQHVPGRPVGDTCHATRGFGRAHSPLKSRS